MTDLNHRENNSSKITTSGSKLTSLALVLLLLGLAEGFIATFHLPKALDVLLALAYGLASGLLILYGARSGMPGAAAGNIVVTGRAVIACAGILVLLLAYGILQAFPNSADEYGYTYLAATLRHHRLWNASFPASLHDVLMTIYLPDQDGKRLSQYPPGWPAVLSLFPPSLSALANPLLGLLSALLLLSAFRELRIAPHLIAPLLAIGILAPFTLFNNASFYNHTLAATCLLAIACFDLREQRRPSAGNQAAIGFGFSVLLTDRYEIFMMAFVLYVADGMLRRRARFVTASLVAAIAALPVVLAFGYYNWRITGSPLTTTLAWGAPNISYGLHATGMNGANTPAKMVANNGRFVTEWAEFASCAILPFLAAALWRRTTARTLRWFDLMLPASVLFFVFYPDDGGFQYGPRYWFAGWVLLPLSLAAGFGNADSWNFRRWSVDPVRLAALQTAAYIGFTAGYAIFAAIQIHVRREPLQAAALAPAPAMVLFGEYALRYVPWQVRTIPMYPFDYTRNGPDGLGPVALARDLGAERTALLCQQVTDRTLWRLRLTGSPPVARLERACP